MIYVEIHLLTEFFVADIDNIRFLEVFFLKTFNTKNYHEYKFQNIYFLSTAISYDNVCPSIFRNLQDIELA